MKSPSQLWSALLQRIAKVAAVIVISVGCFVLIGWILDISVLKSLLPNLVTMKANTALGLTLAGISLFTSTEPTSKGRKISQFCSLVVAALGLATLSQDLFGWDLRIDQLLFLDDPQPIDTLTPGRMSPLTAVCFAFVGSALWLRANRGASLSQSRWVERLAIFTSLITSQVIIAYLYHVQPIIGLKTYTQMAVHTAVCFFVLGIGILMANPEQGLMRIITAYSAGGTIVRRLLPAAIAMPLILGGLEIATARIGRLEPAFITSILVVLHILTFTSLLLWNGKQLHELDLQKQAIARALSQTNEELEVRISERTAQLQAANECLSLAIEGAGMAAWDMDLRTGRGRWSAQHFQLLGYEVAKSGKATIEMWRSRIYPEDLERVMQIQEQAKQENQLLNFEYRIIRADSGELKWVKSVGRFFNDETGQAVRCSGIVFDITDSKLAQEERKQAEQEILNLNQELQRQLAESQTLFEVLPIGVGIAEDPECKKIRVNSAFAQMLAIAPTANASLSAPESDRPTNFQVYQNHRLLAPEELPLQRAAAHGIQVRDFEVDVVWHDGTTLTLLEYAAPLFDEHGQARGSIGVFLDITERKRSEMALKNSLKDLANFKLALDSSSIVAITDTTGTIIYVNDKFCELSQYSKEELIGQNHRIVNSGYHPKEFFQHLWVTISKGQVWQGEIRNRAKDGTFYWVATTIVPFVDATGKPYQYIAVRSDITNRKLAEAELLKLNITLEQRVEERTAQLQEANKDLEAFAYSVAHDLRAPLRGIQGFADVLLEDYGEELDETAQQYIHHIAKGTERMNQLINDLLAYSRLSREQIRLTPVELTQVVTEAQTQLEADLIACQAQIIVAPDLPSVLGHRSVLVQMVANLLSNAVKFVAFGIQPQIRIWARSQDERVRLWVEDNGIGIKLHHQQQIFGVFERLHGTEAYPGTGIGLAIVRKGAERLGGRVGVESAPNQGSRFWIELQQVR